MGPRHITTQVVREAIATTGEHWCRDCALPSGWVQAIVVRFADRMHFQLQAWCDECGGRRCIDLSKS